MSQTTILYLIGDYTRAGGTERAVCNISRILASNHEVKVKIVSLFEGNKTPYYSTDERVEIEWMQLSRKRMWLFYMSFFLKMLFWLPVQRVIVVGTQHGHNMILPFIRFFRPFHKFYASEHMIYDSTPLYSSIARDFLYRFVNGLIVLTEREKKRFFNVNPNIYVIPNPVGFKPKEHVKNSKVLLAIGRLYHLKGFDILIETLEPFLKSHPDWILNIVGDGEDRDSLENRVKEMGIDSNVFFKGQIKDIQMEFDSASIYLMSSRTEAFPMVLLEAMSFSLPLVAYNCPHGPSELIHNGSNGYLVDMWDMKAFVIALEKLANDIELRTKMGREGMNVIGRFSDESINDLWSKAIKL